MSLLDIAGMSVRYGDRIALENVSLAVSPGEIVALVGRSGSGKSTLAAAALGLLPVHARAEGEIRIDRLSLSGLNERQMQAVRGGRVGMVFQEPATALNPALTIGRQIAEVLARHTALDRRERQAEVWELLRRVGLDVAPDHYPHMLSGGQRQRVCIAMAIAAGPKLLIADEPTAALDPITQTGIVELLKGLVRDSRMGLLLIAHDLALVAGLADRIAVLDEGRVVEEGPALPLLRAPRSPELAGMIAALTPPRRAAALPARPIVEVQRVTRRYPLRGALFPLRYRTALDEVSLTLAAGETLAVIGESGSGKSTLARLVLGLDRPDGGAVAIGGRLWRGARGSALRAMRAQVQAVFQDPAASFDPRQTVGRIIAEPLHLLDSPPDAAERTALVAAALADVGLPPDAATRLPRHFSGGQRQRIAIARALILKPAVLVLDEALSALDMRVRADILELLLRLQADHGLAYLFIAHDMELVRGFADRVLVLRDGRMVEEGPVAAVLDAPRDPYTTALVAASPGLAEVLERRAVST